jgi:stalled ribosome alternative rescue factor ArfA
MKTLLFKAQENQKSLQKLIPNKEIESYVKGWNPWEVKKTLFPPQVKQEREGKPKSSTYKRMKYNNQDTWAKVADIASALRSLYKATKRG